MMKIISADAVERANRTFRHSSVAEARPIYRLVTPVTHIMLSTGRLRRRLVGLPGEERKRNYKK